MKNLSEILLEKLKIDKDIEIVDNSYNYVHPSDNDAEDVCNSYKSGITMFCEPSGGRNNVGYIKLMLGDGHFYIKPKSAKTYDEKLPKSPNTSFYLIKDLYKLGLGDSYVIMAYQKRIDTSSRINNLKRTYLHFYLGENGLIFKDKIEANDALKYIKENYSREFKYRVSTIEGLVELEKENGGVYGDSFGDVKFIEK